jgi:hypothetical protein
MEKIMSKTDHTSNLATLDDHGTLEDTELDTVSGGIWFMGYWGPANSSAGGVKGESIDDVHRDWPM